MRTCCGFLNVYSLDERTLGLPPRWCISFIAVDSAYYDCWRAWAGPGGCAAANNASGIFGFAGWRGRAVARSTLPLLQPLLRWFWFCLLRFIYRWMDFTCCSFLGVTLIVLPWTPGGWFGDMTLNGDARRRGYENRRAKTAYARNRNAYAATVARGASVLHLTQLLPHTTRAPPAHCFRSDICYGLRRVLFRFSFSYRVLHRLHGIILSPLGGLCCSLRVTAVNVMRCMRLRRCMAATLFSQ
jgi:hypothetical protein